MTAAVHDGRHLSSGYPDTSIYEKQRADEIKMVRLLTADSSDKRDDGLDRMKAIVQSTIDELSFSGVVKSMRYIDFLFLTRSGSSASLFIGNRFKKINLNDFIK